MSLFHKLTDYMSGRSADAARNIILSMGAKGITVIVGLVIIPLTIDYINPTQYGIWLTLSQIIGWISFFDLGIGNGFRNRFAEAKANGDMLLARQYLSTTYFASACLAILILLVLLPLNSYINWSGILKVSSDYNEELRLVFAIVCSFFCVSLVAGITGTMLTADQKPGISALIGGAGQLLFLVALIILIKTTDGSLSKLALFYSGVPCLVMIVASVLVFRCSGYYSLRPSLKYICPRLIGDIMGIGLKFFLIYLCMIAVFQVINLVVSRELGPDSVTEYNIAFRYFSIVYSVMLIIVNPFWSAFTDASVKNDRHWMKSVIGKLEKVWLLFLVIGLLMLAISPIVYRIWIGTEVSVSFGLSVCTMAFVLMQSLANIYMYLINGIGTVRIQLVTYLFFAVISWPLLTFSCRRFGIMGITAVPILTYLVQAVISKIQIEKLVSGKATGWWAK